MALLMSAGAWVVGCSDSHSPPKIRADADEGDVRAKLSACTGMALDYTVAYSIAQSASILGQSRSCIAETNSCDEVIRCTGVEPISCEPPGRCEGSVARRCAAYPNGVTYEWLEDCGADPAGNNQCFLHPDDPSALPSCGGNECESAPPLSCVDNGIVYCMEGRERRVDCSERGGTCMTDTTNSWTFCASGIACEASFCDDSVAVDCGAGFERDRIDCRDRVPNGTCELIEDTPTCVASERSPDCSEERDYRSWCEGTLGVACVLGARITTDCSAFENARCVNDEAQAAASCELQR